MNLKKLTTGAALAALAALLLAAPAPAHITIEPATSPADGFATLQFSVPHDCEGSPTRSVRVRIPDTVPYVKPLRHPLWRLEIKEGPKQRTELFGETITRGPSEVTWTTEQPLPNEQLDVLAMSVKLPATPGQTLNFPTIQQCVEGVHRWIQVPAEGQNPDDLEEPVPTVELTAAEGGHGGSSGGGEQDEEAEAAEDDDDDASQGLGLLALGIGALGLVTGGTGLLLARRRRP